MLPALMQATSRESLDRLRATLEQAAVGADAASVLATSGELAQAAAVLASEPALRRALSDPSAEQANRQALAARLFGSQLSPLTNDIIGHVATSSWSKAGDLVDGLTDLSHQAAFISAEKDGSFGAVEEDIFRFGRVLDANGDLEQALSDQSSPLERRRQLLGGIVDGKTNAISSQLLHGVLANPRARSMYNSVQALVEDAAGRRRRSVAIVTAPLPLTAAQESRLVASLTRIYGREISVSVDVDRSVLGGLRVQVGDDVIDGSIAGRLDDIQRRFAG